jgi:hypothetical protein
MHPVSNRPDPADLQTVWSTPELVTPHFVAFTAEAIYWLEECKPVEAADYRRRLAAGERPADVFPPEAQVLPLSKLVSVTIDRGEDCVTLGYWQGEDDLEDLAVYTKDGAGRDRLLDHLHRHLGEKWKVTETKYSRLGAMWVPLSWMAGVAAVTALLWWFATSVAEEAALNGGKIDGKDWKTWLVSEALFYLTPTGVLILGGVVVALIGWWLVERVKQPPHEIVLMRTDG